MSHSYTEETDTLTRNIFDSYIEWNIVNFDDYSQRDIGSITSRKVPFEGTDVNWILHVHPHGCYLSSSFEEDFISLSLQINCKNPSKKQCFKIEVKTDVVGLQMTSPFDENKSQHITATDEPIEWIVEYENVDKRHHFEMFKEDFIKVDDLHKYMFDGTLRLMAKVSMKLLDI